MQTLIANVSRLTIAARDGLDWLDGMAAGENGQNAEVGAQAVGDQASVTSLSSLPTNKKTSTDSIEHFTAVGVFELMVSCLSFLISHSSLCLFLLLFFLYFFLLLSILLLLLSSSFSDC
jgi:hypothetical protein